MELNWVEIVDVYKRQVYTDGSANPSNATYSLALLPGFAV